jgi:alpha-L-rhamnosidase
MDGPKGKLVAQAIEPNRVVDVLHPVALTEPQPGVWIVDFGQAFYGQLRIKVRGPAGTTVRMMAAYSLKSDGTLKTVDNRNANCADIYILKGQGEETWCPVLRGQGFRRVQVTGWPGKPEAGQFEGLVVASDVAKVGSFACSNPLINRIHRNIFWGARMYKRHGVPLDPDRDERQGWLGDPAKDAESDAFNFNVAAFYSKWLGDVRLDQREDGSIGDISPNFWDWGSGVLWPSVVTIIPEWLYDFYGDRRALEENYEAIRKWMVFHQKRLEPDFTVSKDSYGDWCDVSTMDKGGTANGCTAMPVQSTAYYFNNCRITARLAKMLGKPDDEKLFIELGEKVKTGFNARFMKADGSCTSDTQCAYVLMLKFGLVPLEKRDAIAARLVDDIMVKNKGHLTVGLIGMQWLMQVLTEIGRPDVGYTIATQTTRPSWGYMIAKDATTIWERWDCDTQGGGMNSEALLILSGNLDAWFYQTLAGINYDPAQPAFRHIIIKPQPVGDLTFAEGAFDSMFGRIVSNWKLETKNLKLDVTIPPNTSATVYVPAINGDGVTESGKPAAKAAGVKFLRMENGAAVYEVGSGSYRFCSEILIPKR